MKNDPKNPSPDESGVQGLAPHQVAEADALEAALAGRLDGSSIGRDEGELSEMIGRVRAAYDVGTKEDGATNSDAFQAKRVAQRVLERTTREDLRRRGDVGVLLRFASDRLRDSALLRVAAALLIVQLTLVPLVAWQMLTKPQTGIFYTGIEPSAEELAKALEDLPAEEFSSDLGEETEPLGSIFDQEALENGAHEAAELLGDVRLKLPSELEPTTAAGRALAAMTELAVRERCTAADTELVRGLGMAASPAESIAVAEAHLFLLACGGGWEGLMEALDLMAQMTGGEAATAGAIPTMSARTVRRAATMGVAISDRGDALVEVAGGQWERSVEGWLVQLGKALAVEAPEDPYVAAWVQAIVQDS